MILCWLFGAKKEDQGRNGSSSAPTLLQGLLLLLLHDAVGAVNHPDTPTRRPPPPMRGCLPPRHAVRHIRQVQAPAKTPKKRPHGKAIVKMKMVLVDSIDVKLSVLLLT
jgi:hypothetical protein